MAQIELNIKGVERGCGVDLELGEKGKQICSKYIVCTYKILKELMKMYFQKVYQGKIRRKSISFLLTALRMCGYGARAEEVDK